MNTPPYSCTRTTPGATSGSRPLTRQALQILGLAAFLGLSASLCFAATSASRNPAEVAPAGLPMPVTGAQPGAAASIMAAAATPASDGYRALDLTWNDSGRQREIPVRLYWPDAASKAAPVPLVVFSHGLGGSRAGYSYLGRHWASLGFASLHVQHAGSDRAVWGGNIFKLVGSLQTAASEANAIDRAKDVSFAITTILGSKDYGAQINAAAIAVAGHSYGANTALLVGGATVERDGKPLSLRDNRVKALVLISAPPFTGEGDMVNILNPVKLPTLHVTGTDDVIRVPGYYSDLGDRIAVFDALRGSEKLLTVFKGATHSIFTDRSDRGGNELAVNVKRATRELSGLFLKAVLAGAPGRSVDDWVQAQQVLLDRHAGSFSTARR